MRATFIGANGSMELKHGETYSIRSAVHNNIIIIAVDHKRIPYASVEAFARNWVIVRSNRESI